MAVERRAVVPGSLRAVFWPALSNATRPVPEASDIPASAVEFCATLI